MQIERNFYIPQQIITFGGVLAVLAMSAVGGIYLGRFGFDYQLIIMGLGLATGLISLALGERGIRAAFLIWLLMFILGYRTITFSGAVIHPLSIIIIGLFILIILQVGIIQRDRVQFNVPIPGWAFNVFWVWGFLLGYTNGPPYWESMSMYIGRMTTHVLNLAIAIPIFVVVSFVLKKKDYWKWSLSAMVAASTLIAILGALEWHVPAVKSLIPGSPADVGAISAEVTGFVRPPFAFWGHASATFICNIMLPLILPLWVWYKRPLIRLALVLVTIANLYGIYLTGWRSMWATTIIVLGIMTVLSRNWLALFIAFVALIILLIFAPPEAKARFETFTDALQGKVSEQDSSSQVRFSHIKDTEEMIARHPLGSGLTASGWVHNDPLQMAADMGVLSVVVFGLWYIASGGALLLMYLRSPDPLALGLIGSFMVLAAIFLTQPTYQHTQLMAPFWTIWALVYTKLREPNSEEENNDGQSKTYSSDPDLQLRNTSSGLHGISQVG